MVDYKSWLHGDENIRPYIFVRKENRPKNPGRVHQFPFPNNTMFLDPLNLEQSDFATAILALENTVFKTLGLVLPRWALYDCSVMPGFVVGFAVKTKVIGPAIRKVLPVNDKLEWTPISLFICIPTVEENHWVAHNLCSVNSLLERKDHRSCLGFLSKALGLWYGNIVNLYGVTQWKNTALGVHSNFGLLELITAYTPIHSIPASLTYLAKVDSQLWHRFVEEENSWVNPLTHAGFEVNPEREETLISLHHRIEKGEGPFYLSPDWDYKNPQTVPLFRK